MNAIHGLLDSFQSLIPLERLGWVLIQSFWQGAAAAILLALLLAALRDKSSRARYAAASGAMALIAMTFAATSGLAFIPLDGHGNSVNIPKTALVVGSEPQPVLAAALEHGSPPNSSSDLKRTGLRAMSYAWLLGIAVMSVWNLLGWSGVQRLRRQSRSAPAAWQLSVSNNAKLMRLRRHVTLALGNRIDMPAVIGWLRPVILIPTGVLTGLPPAQVEALLLHELAHIRRHDYLINLIQTAIETILFYHPAVWWVGAQIRQERENCCDDVAVKHCGSRLTYARALASAAQLRGAATPMLALGCDGGKLRARIERLLVVGAARRRAPAAGHAIFLAASVALLAMSYQPLARANATSASGPGAAASQPATVDTVRPEDLVLQEPRDYTIGPADLVAITISDLGGPNSQTLKQCRVSASGNISLPYLDTPVHATGLTDIQLEQAIIKAYRDAGLIQRANVSATILEARGRMFNVIGAVSRPGQFLLSSEPDVRLLDAIAIAGGTSGDVGVIRVLRKAQGNQPARTIELAGSKLVAGDRSLNIVVRPGDTILVAGGDVRNQGGAEKVARLVVGGESLIFQGKPITWEQLPAELQKVNDRAHIVLELSAQSSNVTVGRYFEARRRAADLAAKLGFKSLIQVEVQAWSAP